MRRIDQPEEADVEVEAQPVGEPPTKRRRGPAPQPA
jgi:hypothetical protein